MFIDQNPNIDSCHKIQVKHKITTQKIIKQQIQEETLMDKLKEHLKMEAILLWLFEALLA